MKVCGREEDGSAALSAAELTTFNHQLPMKQMNWQTLTMKNCSLAVGSYCAKPAPGYPNTGFVLFAPGADDGNIDYIDLCQMSI